jgi:broad specificity phosphatase PhoE
MPLSVLFVRHGESEANIQDMLVSERFDPILTPRGREEARNLARMWASQLPCAIYASPLTRSIDTAKIWRDETHGPSVQIDPRLHEIRLGDFDGQIIRDLEKNDSARYQLWKDDPESPPTNGEKLSAVGERMAGFLDMIGQNYDDGLVVAITHADCLKAVTLHILRAPWPSAHFLHFANVAGVHVAQFGDSFQILALPLAPPAHAGSL